MKGRTSCAVAWCGPAGKHQAGSESRTVRAQRRVVPQEESTCHSVINSTNSSIGCSGPSAAGDGTAAAELYADDAVFRMAGVPRHLGGVVEGRAAIAIDIEQRPPSRLEVRQVFGDGASVCAVVKRTGPVTRTRTFRGTGSRGLPRTNAPSSSSKPDASRSRRRTSTGWTHTCRRASSIWLMCSSEGRGAGSSPRLDLLAKTSDRVDRSGPAVRAPTAGRRVRHRQQRACR